MVKFHFMTNSTIPCKTKKVPQVVCNDVLHNCATEKPKL